MPMLPMSIIDTEAILLMIYRDICRLRINNAFIDNDQGTIGFCDYTDLLWWK